MEQGTHQRELLFHAARQLGRWTRAEWLHAGHGEKLMAERGVLLLADPEEVAIEVHVFLDGEIAVQTEALRHVADLIFNGIQFAGDVMTNDPGLAFGWIEQAAEQ